MGNFTKYTADSVHNHFLRAGGHAAVPQPAGLFLALCTADPTRAGSLANEVTGGGYARQPIAFDAPADHGTAPNITSRTQNSAKIDFPQASAAWGTVTHWVVVDVVSGAGNPIYQGALDAPEAVNANNVFELAQGALIVDLS